MEIIKLSNEKKLLEQVIIYQIFHLQIYLISDIKLKSSSQTYICNLYCEKHQLKLSIVIINETECKGGEMTMTKLLIWINK